MFLYSFRALVANYVIKIIIFYFQVTNPFATKHFVWIDAGFSHRSPEKWMKRGAFDWHPYLPHGKISLLKRTTKADKVTRYTLNDLYHRRLIGIL